MSSLKTSFLKWKPEYELAADSYTKAATCFKTAKELEKSKECLYKASDCYKQTKAYPFLPNHKYSKIFLYIYYLKDKMLKKIGSNLRLFITFIEFPKTCSYKIDVISFFQDSHFFLDFNS